MYHYSRSKRLETLRKSVFTKKYATAAIVLALVLAYQYSHAQHSAKIAPETVSSDAIRKTVLHVMAVTLKAGSGHHW